MDKDCTTPDLIDQFQFVRRAICISLLVLLNPIHITEAQVVSGGFSFSCAVDEGRVKCWGANTTGQLGNSRLRSLESYDDPPSLQPSAVFVDGIDSATSVVTGYDYACALLDDGEVVCWGNNNRATIGERFEVLRNEAGSLRIQSFKTPQQIRGLGGAAVQISAGGTAPIYHNPSVCALIDSGDVMCWGDGDPVPRRVEGVSTVSKISGNCALNADSGEVYCWHVEVLEWTESDGVIDAEVRRIAEPLYLGGHRAKDIAVGSDHACIIEQEFGRVICWGNNDSGQAGTPTHIPYSTAYSRTIDAASPIQVYGTENSVDIAVGNKHSCAIISYEDDTTAAFCWGNNQKGQLGNGFDSENNYYVTLWPVSSLDNPVEIALGWDHSCATTRENEVLCWGNDDNGATGRPERTLNKMRLPLSVNGLPKISAYTAGSSETCGRSLGNNVLCVGEGEFKRLNPLSQSFYTPYSGANSAVSNLKSLDTKNGVMCAIGGDDGLYCWGENRIGVFSTNLVAADGRRYVVDLSYYGRLGYVPSDNHGGSEFQTKPFKIERATTRFDEPRWLSFEDAEFVSVSVGEKHACAITAPFHAFGSSQRKVLCWGGNLEGESGATSRTRPDSETLSTYRHDWNSQVQHIPFVKSTHTDDTDSIPTVATGDKFSCIATEDIVWCWGSDDFGARSGFRTWAGDHAFTEVLQDPGNIKQVVAGKNHVCALLHSGRVKCWGDDSKGQLGDGITDFSGAGVRTVDGIDNAVMISAAGHHTCVVSEQEYDGETTQLIECWGSNEEDQIDRSAPSILHSPRRILNQPMRIVSIDAGEKHNCALYEDQVLRCWGNNDDGQLGSLYQVKPMHVERF